MRQCTNCPFSMTRTSSATANASRRSCSTSSTPTPSARISPSTSPIWRTTAGARPSEGSSISTSRGLAISARVTASICCSPPDRWRAGCSIRSPRRGNSSSTRSRVHGPSRRQHARPATGARGRSAARTRAGPAARARRRRARARPGGGRRARVPSIRTPPPRGRSSPVIACTSVDLPTPLRPRIATAPPLRHARGRRRAAPCRAGSPRPARRPRAASLITASSMKMSSTEAPPR